MYKLIKKKLIEIVLKIKFNINNKVILLYMNE